MKEMKSIFASRPCLSLPEAEAYLQGRTSSEQRYEVENHLLDCPLCAAALEGLAQSENAASQARAVTELKPPLPSRAARTAQLRRMALINRAAAAVLLLLLAFAGYRYWGATAEERLFAQYFQTMESPYLVLRSGEPDIQGQPELRAAVGYYRAGDFAASLPHFENYLDSHGPDPQARLMAVNACLKTGRPEQAEQYLLVLQAEDAQLQGRPKWYLALAYLKAGKTELAQQTLRSIDRDQHSLFRQQAAALLEKI